MKCYEVSATVISSDFTFADKSKRFGRSLWHKTQSFFFKAKDKASGFKDAIAHLLTKLSKTSKRCYDEVRDIIDDINQDLSGREDMGLVEFFLGPIDNAEQPGGNLTSFTPTNAAGSMMGAVTSQGGVISEEQLENFAAIATASTENVKRLKDALKHIGTVDGNETETTKLVFQQLNQIDRNAHKRREYEAKRRQESQVLQAKYDNLRKGL